MDNLKSDMLMPIAPLGIICMQSSRELGDQINKNLVMQRRAVVENGLMSAGLPGYIRDCYLINHDTPRFANGEGKGIIYESIRGKDLYIICDIGNYSCKYKMFGTDYPMSPDDHFADLKRVIAATGGKANRISVIMPLLYESRQHRRSARESLDCALALQELERLGVENIITFDAHDPRVQNATPLSGFENIYPTYQIIKAMFNNIKNLSVHKDNMMIISPDEGGMGRSLYYSSMLNLDVGMFYKRRDYTRLINGRNPIVSHEYLGESVSGKDILIVDDILSSGDSVIDIALELKKRNAKRTFVAVTFALFTDGLEKFNQLYKEGIIDGVFATNLTYGRPGLLEAPWYYDVNMSKFLSLIIDTLNHDQSISTLLNPAEKIQNLINQYNLFFQMQ